MSLIGNASSHLSRLRREKVVTSVNKALLPLVKEDDHFAGASPNLFGPDFAKRSKEFLEQVKALRSSLPVRVQKTLFSQGPPLGEGVRPPGEKVEPPRSGRTDRTDQIKDKCSSTTHLQCGIKKTNDCLSYSKYTSSKGNVSPGYSDMPSGSAGLFYKKLGVDNKGSVDPEHSDRVSNRISFNCMSDPEATHPTGQPISESKKLLSKGAVTEVHHAPSDSFYSTLFIVPKKDGGQRPVINLKQLNAFVQNHHFKMEGIHTLKSLLRQGDWLVKIDLKDAYFSIPIHPDHRKYLSFSVGKKSYHFTCLPFSLASAPLVFTKTLRPVAALGRELGMRMIIYIDDILLLATSREKALDHGSGLVYLLQCLGFTINSEKTILEPTQSLEFLGFTVNTLKMELNLPPQKIKRIQAESRKLLEAEHVSARALSRIIGKMNATNQVIPPAPLFYRHLQMNMATALRAANQDYDTTLTLFSESKEELTWWETRNGMAGQL